MSMAGTCRQHQFKISNFLKVDSVPIKIDKAISSCLTPETLNTAFDL